MKRKVSGTASESSPESEGVHSTLQQDFACLKAFPNSEFWIEGNAKAVFFDQYVNVSSRNSAVKTDLGFVPYIYGDTATNGMLESVVSALGLAFLQQRDPSDQALQHFAIRRYFSALRLTSRALQDQTLAKSDEALATVLLLAVHELVAMERSAKGDEIMSVHLEGAIKLLQLRGTSQMATIWGRRMVLRTSIETVNACLYCRKPIPHTFINFQRSVRHKMHPEELAVADLTEIGVNLCHVLSQSTEKSFDTKADAFEALATIIQELDLWALNSITPRLSVEKVPVQNPDKSFLTYWESHHNHIAGSVRNTYQCMLIQSQEEVLRLSRTLQVQSNNARLPELIRRAPFRIVESAEAICRSVPFFLGEKGSTHTWTEEPAEPPSMYGAISILTPLRIAVSPECIPLPTKDWAFQQIHRIARATGVARARFLLCREDLPGVR